MEEEIEAVRYTQQFDGTIECHNCAFWGPQTGYVDPEDDRFIQFICPKCNGVSKVINVLGI